MLFENLYVVNIWTTIWTICEQWEDVTLFHLLYNKYIVNCFKIYIFFYFLKLKNYIIFVNFLQNSYSFQYRNTYAYVFLENRNEI